MKPKTCKCGNEYTQYTTMQNCCIECLAEKVAKNRIKSEKTAQKAQKRELIKAKEAIKTRQEWIKDVQQVFNQYIRARDHDQPCISCQRHHTGQYHAGHYRTTKAAPELRFEELNAHKQCSVCNNHLSGNILEYRINLIKKIGINQVEWLESASPPKKYTIPELKELKELYKYKLKEVKNA